MNFKMRLLRKRFVTYGALKRFVPRMYQIMCKQRSRMCKRFLAYLTNIRLFSSVNLQWQHSLSKSINYCKTTLWTLECDCKSAFLTNPFPQSLHKKDFSPCTISCFFRNNNLANSFPQVLHLYSNCIIVSPVGWCFFMWRLQAPCLLKVRSQNLHVNCVWTVWYFWVWAFKHLEVINPKSQ